MSSNTRNEYVLKYLAIGRAKFYKYLLSSAIFKVATLLESKTRPESMPDVELIEMYEKFLSYYRREDDLVCLEIALICRRAGHRIYRALLKQHLVDKNNRFLNVVD